MAKNVAIEYSVRKPRQWIKLGYYTWNASEEALLRKVEVCAMNNG